MPPVGHSGPVFFSKLGHASRHEAPDLNLFIKSYRPENRPTCAIGFGDHRFIGNIDPLVVEADKSQFGKLAFGSFECMRRR
jgi:hypothetical protein